MAKSSNQKLKLIYLAEIFEKYTDDEHCITISQMIDMLAVRGISAERKSIYNDIEALRSFGMDIECKREKTTGYYLASRNFELAELKLLVDLVQCSKFITHRKSNELIKKLESLTSDYQAQLMQRQVIVTNRIKTMNESIYYNVDAIHSAIAHNKKISFKYFEYTVSKERKFRKNGDKYVISPLALNWSDSNYYLIAYDSEAEKIKHYRVDKMTSINTVDEPREGLEQFAKVDMAQYSKRVFSMYSGKEHSVRLQFDNSLIGVVIDKFGKDVVVSAGTDNFTINVNVMVSAQFFGWLAGLGCGAQIVSPQSVKERYAAHLKEILAIAEK
ncbi:MAG: WYL domain-containing protein [Oscillospiraceae bacterium]|nr:WYL domain-containing protein [Oscillospiraceae bacterium]